MIQAWDMVAGSNWVHGMNQGVARAARVVAVLSPNYLASMYGTAEWQAAWADDPQGEKRKLITIRVRGDHPTGLLAAVVGIELIGLSEAAARQRPRTDIATAMRGRAKPGSPPPFPLPRAVQAEPQFPGVSLVRVREASPRQLGVHAAIRVDGATGELPLYVPRDVDVELRSAIRVGASEGCFMLLLGRSSVGKTRCGYEAILSELPDWWPFHPSCGDKLRAFAQTRTAHTVVWLDELQNYLMDGLAAATIRELCRSPVVIIGTMWFDRHQTYAALPADGMSDDPYRRERELLALADVIDIAEDLSAEGANRPKTPAVPIRVSGRHCPRIITP